MKNVIVKAHITKMPQSFFDPMPRVHVKGDTISTCQRTALQYDLNELSYSVNGVEDNDFIKDPDY